MGNQINITRAAIALIVSSGLSFMSACGYKNNEEKNINNPDINNQSNAKEEAVNCNPQSKEDRVMLFTKNISITREFQRTIRYKCDRSIKSDQLETIASPHGGDLVIEPKVAQGNNKTNYKGHWKIKNRSHCKGNTSYRYEDPDRYGAILFLDMAPGFFSFQVIEGENLIDYDFYSCGKVDDNNYCTEKELEEHGTVVVNVDYKESTAPGFREIYPLVDECNSTQK